MTDNPISFSFPRGAECNRSEQQARADLTMADVIRLGSRSAKPRLVVQHKNCPWCAADPLPAALVHGRYVVCCENEDCKIDVQATGDTPEEAWKIWDARP